MDFLKKHGEKILFLVLAAGLGGSLFMVLNEQGIFQRASEVQLKAAEITLDTQDLKDSIAQLSTDKPEVAASLDAFTSSVRNVCVNEACPHPLIPADIKICPYCGTEQTGVGIDSDDGGIPDTEEKSWGMNPNDPSDELEDLDSDGFINLVEFQEGTDPTDSNAYPPLVEYIRLDKIDSKSIQFELLGFNQLTDDVYSLQIRWAYPGENQWNRGFVKTGTRFGRNNEFFAEKYVEKRTRQPDGRYVDESYASIQAGRHQLQLGRYGERSRAQVTESLATLKLIAGPQWSEEVRVGSSFELDKKSYKVIDIQNDSIVIQADEAESTRTLRRATQEEVDRLNPPEPEQKPGMEGVPMDGMIPQDFFPQY